MVPDRIQIGENHFDILILSLDGFLIAHQEKEEEYAAKHISESD